MTAAVLASNGGEVGGSSPPGWGHGTRHAETRVGNGMARRLGRPRRRPRSTGRYPWVTATRAYAADMRAVLELNTVRERERKLLYIGKALERAKARKEIATTDPRRFGKREADCVATWIRDRGFSVGYEAKLWQYVEALLRYKGNDVLLRLEAKGTWRRPRPSYRPPVVKDEAWLRDALRRLDAIGGWRPAAVRFAIAFTVGMGLRPKELRKADLEDLDAEAWTFVVRHPKGERTYGETTEIDVYQDARPHVVDFLARRRARLEELGIPEARPLVPNEEGGHYTEPGWRNMRWKVFRQAGIDGNYKVLRATHEQLLMDRLEAIGYREGGVIEVASKRLRHTPATATRHYADLRTRRARTDAKLAWEATTLSRAD